MGNLEDETLLNRSRIHSIIDALKIAAAETDSLGRVTWVSEAWCRMADLELAEARGNGWVIGIHPADRARVREDWQLAVAEQRIYDDEFRMALGQRVRAISQICENQGRVIGYCAVIVPITEE